MELIDALKMAGRNGKIVRASDLKYDSTYYVQATDTKGRLIAFTHGEQLSVCWEPTFTDLVANDWLVVQKGDPYRKEESLKSI